MFAVTLGEPAMGNSHKLPVAEQPFLADDIRHATTWSEARRRVEEPGGYWLPTVRPDGRPHIVPVLAVWVNDALYFVANATSRKARNFARDPRCSITAERHPHHLIFEGRAVMIRDEPELGRVAGAYGSHGWPVEVRERALHAEGAPSAGPAPYDVYALTPTVAFGFGTDETVVPTRWRF